MDEDEDHYPKAVNTKAAPPPAETFKTLITTRTAPIRLSTLLRFLESSTSKIFKLTHEFHDLLATRRETLYSTYGARYKDDYYFPYASEVISRTAELDALYDLLSSNADGDLDFFKAENDKVILGINALMAREKRNLKMDDVHGTLICQEAIRTLLMCDEYCEFLEHRRLEAEEEFEDTMYILSLAEMVATL